jgi:protein-L-isoaspartate(D-aspartate) O-methyltransferase
MMTTMHELVDAMISSGTLQTPSIIDAFRAVDRKYFVPKVWSNEAYMDNPLPIGDGQTISQPSTVAFMLEKLAPKKGDKVLDIGSGSGWTTALLCHIVGEEGSVTGLERVTALVQMGQENLSKFDLAHGCIKHAANQLGIPGEQFDRILVSAAAEEIPEELFAQLKVGGTLVIPVENSIYQCTKLSEEEIKIEEFYGFVFVPLIY